MCVSSVCVCVCLCVVVVVVVVVVVARLNLINIQTLIGWDVFPALFDRHRAVLYRCLCIDGCKVKETVDSVCMSSLFICLVVCV